MKALVRLSLEWNQKLMLDIEDAKELLGILSRADVYISEYGRENETIVHFVEEVIVASITQDRIDRIKCESLLRAKNDSE